jgi:hypothetical protein
MTRRTSGAGTSRTTSNASPAIALGGILDSHDVARVVLVRKNFIPGRYVLHCAMLMSMDAKSGELQANYADAGMVRTFEVN